VQANVPCAASPDVSGVHVAQLFTGSKAFVVDLSFHRSPVQDKLIAHCTARPLAEVRKKRK
jgi:hypothetical protein